jgi:hypothetical protein
MRPTVFVFLLTAATMIFAGTPANAEKVRCTAIRDSAICTAEPGCWYDAANNKGCQDGPPPAQDRCAVHESESTCNTSSFGCAWNAGDESCTTKSN